MNYFANTASDNRQDLNIMKIILCIPYFVNYLTLRKALTHEFNMLRQAWVYRFL